MSTSSTESSADVRGVDRELLEALRGGESLGVSDLTDRLGVTATAVRQRVERLLEAGLVEREKVVAGRGRPTFNYRLTLLGHRRAGADHAQLADAMWREITQLEPVELRLQLLSRIARRLGRNYRQQLTAQRSNRPSASPADDTLESRMQSLTEVLAGHRIPADVVAGGDLPILGFKACPHPDLATESERRAMCHLEEQMLSEALGSEVHLRSCRLDGDSCCQFAPVSTSREALGGDTSAPPPHPSS